MPRSPDLVGQVFGRLTVMHHAGKRGARVLWDCLCECDGIIQVTTSGLRCGETQSCGCLLRGPTSANARHGQSGRNETTRTYNSWRGMMDRCSNPNHRSYPRYGGRGISVCERWSDFQNFLKDMGERPPAMTLDRKHADGNYEPSNCRWATNLEQRHNRSTRRDGAS